MQETSFSSSTPETATPPAVKHRRSLPTLTVETLLWTVLVLAAVVTRFWDLGYRTVHHDESLHTYYSWLFAEGQGYVHNPLMHGPFLFHANALIYKLFGASDATSRLVPAAFGVALVFLPWLLRGKNFLGKWGALAAGYLLLISPSYLYYTRYIRHDPYMAGGSLLLVIAIFRYLERPQRRWIIIAFACVGFLLTNHELIFASFLGMVMILWGALLIDRLRPLIPVHIGAILALGLAWVFLGHRKPWPKIPWDNATDQTTRVYYDALLAHPFVFAFLVIGALFVLACVYILWDMVRKNPNANGAADSLFGGAKPGTVAFGALHALKDSLGLVIGAVVALAIFGLLFTSFLSNPRGLETATYAPDGTLLYWLGQQEVQRGHQPWFYFITEGFQYEWLGIFFTVAGLVLLAVRTARAWRGGTVASNYFFNLFNAWWFVFLFAVLSWAGEKMPWLIMHFALPGFLLSAWVINEVIEGAIEWRRGSGREHGALHRYGLALVTGSLIMLALTWFFLAASKTYSAWMPGVEPDRHAISASNLSSWWQQAIPALAALCIIAAAIWVLGPRKTAYASLTALFIVFSAFQIHQSFRMVYLEGDVAVDSLIYNTTTDDITNLITDFEIMSQARYGDNSISIVYDQCELQWPSNWYFRDLPNARFGSAQALAENPDVILVHPNGSCGFPNEIPGYTSQRLILRWHEPEAEVYRNFAIAPEIPVGWSAWESVDQAHGPLAIVRSIGDSVQYAATPEGQQRLVRLVLFREMPANLMSFDFKVYIRNDMLPYYSNARYGD